MSAAFAPAKPGKKTYSVKEAAIYLDMSVSTIRRLIRRKLLRTSKVLRKIRIIGEDVETLDEKAI